MIGTGLPTPSAPAMPAAPYAMPKMPSLGNLSNGMMSAQSLASMKAQQTRSIEAELQAQQAAPVITGLAGHIRSFFTQADTARLDVQNKMIEAMYARRGEYMADKRALIIAQGQPEIYMMLPSVKMRQAESLLRDVSVGAGTEKPWTLAPTPVPDLPHEEVQKIREAVTSEVEQALAQGLEVTLQDVRDRLQAAKTELIERTREEADVRCKRMEDKMEDQLQEGGFAEAFDQFLTDLTTFKAAFIVGPIIRKKPRLTWGPDGQPVTTMENVMEWERADPFDMYPAPWARSIDDGSPLIRKHRLTRSALNAMIGVEGYSEAAIRKVLEMYGVGGLSDHNQVDSQKARAEGKLMTAVTAQSGLIDALQYWGSVSGAMLRSWGMTEEQVPDAAKEYEVEAWCVGSFVIKAVLNADPLARRPVYSNCYERIPGSVWGNSVYDLMRDCADVCNSSARALCANLGISSGPQVDVNMDRLAPGQQVQAMSPWQIWQTISDPMGSTSKAVNFFQPQSNAAELMQVFAKFSDLADEYTGIPKYTVGAEAAGGAGRTASGMSMMLGNASKIIKSVVGNNDNRVFLPLLERMYYFNMRYATDPDLKGDVRCVPRGALSLQTKETMQQRNNELLAATNNPTDLEIIGFEGRAELLRTAVMGLGGNPSKVVPPVAVLKDRQKLVQMQQAQAAAAGQGPEANTAGGSQPAPGGPAVAAGNGQALMAPGGQPGAPVTDTFSPQPQN